MTRRRPAARSSVPSRCPWPPSLHRPGCRDVTTAPHLAVDPGPSSSRRSPPPPATTSPSPTASATADPVRFSALGDIGSTERQPPCCGPSPGATTTSPSPWATSPTAERGRGQLVRLRYHAGRREVPFELVSGNHESDGENGDIDRFTDACPNRLPGLMGTYGRQWYVDRPAEHPLVRVVMISPALDFGHGTWSYDEGRPATPGCGRRSPGRGRPASRGSSSACTSPASRSAATSATPAPTSSTSCSRPASTSS